MIRKISRSEWRALFDALPLLACIPETLRAVAERWEIEAGKTLFRLGDRPKGMFYVISGEVRLIRRSRSGAEVVLQRSRGGFIAEASLGFRAYHCDAVAAEDSAILRFPATAFRARLDEDASFRSAWSNLLAGEVRKLRAQCERLSLRAATDRIIHYIESEGSDGVLTLNQSRKAWAAELGLTHEALYRAVARLTAKKSLIAEGKRLSLIQLPGWVKLPDR
jgi:CRP-like cAMP-binding protein